MNKALKFYKFTAPPMTVIGGIIGSRQYYEDIRDCKNIKRYEEKHGELFDNIIMGCFIGSTYPIWLPVYTIAVIGKLTVK